MAWYTVDIPLPYGPYKFYGLPGLVVEVEDSTHLYVWELKAMRNVVLPIELYTYEGEQKCFEKDAVKTIERIEKQPIRFWNRWVDICIYKVLMVVLDLLLLYKIFQFKNMNL